MKPGDGLVLFGAVTLIIYLYWSYWGSSQQAKQVEIKTPYEHLQVSLSQDQILHVNGPLGVTDIQIDQGRVRFTASPCVQKLCIRSGWLNRSGQFAACLPNRVSLSVLGLDSQYDAINF